MRPDAPIRRARGQAAAARSRQPLQRAKQRTGHARGSEPAPGAEKTMRRFLADVANSGYSFLFVAAAGERTVGFISGELRQGSPTFLPKTWASVDDVFVAPEYRNRGMGRALLKRVQSWARERGADGISLQVAAANSRGRKFYEDLGFRDVSVYKVLEFE